MADETEPLVWVHRLENRLNEQRKHARKYDKYYRGERELEVVKRDYREVFGTEEIAPPRTNVAAVGVDAVSERLGVQRVRVGDPEDDEGNKAARELWRRNELDVMETICHVETLVKGSAFTLTWPGPDGAVVSIEDCEQMAVARRQSPPYDVIAALKVYTDEWTGQELSVLYRPEGMYKFASGSNQTLWTPTGQAVKSRWRARDPAFTRAPSQWARRDRVPVVEFADRQRLLSPPQSELVNVAPLADAHAKILADLVIAASFGAVPIRTATGIRMPRDEKGNLKRHPVTGELEPPFDVRADRAMVSERKEAKFGSLPPGDLAGYVAALDMLLREIRTITRVPLHYYGQSGLAGTSGETLKSSEASLVRRVQGMHPRFGLPWRKTVAFGLALDAPDHAKATDISVQWTDPETRIRAAQVDQAAKLAEMEVPLEIVLVEELGYDRATVDRAMALRERAQLRGEEILRGIEADAIRLDDGTTADVDEPATAAA